MNPAFQVIALLSATALLCWAGVAGAGLVFLGWASADCDCGSLTTADAGRQP